MKTDKRTIGKYALYALLVLCGVFVGWLVFGGSGTANDGKGEQTSQTAEKQIWTCSMHPQIKQDKPGKCPLCGMDLTPMHEQGGGGAVDDPNAVQLSEEAAALADVQTTEVTKGDATKSIRLYGKIAPDERKLQSQTAYVGGRIEKLHVSFTGESVRKGQTLATIYSPDLFAAQKELQEAVKLASPQLVEAAKEKLRLWNLTDEQVERIVMSGDTSPYIDIKSNTGGVVMTKRVSQGDYVSQGAVLFDVADLSSVWAVFDAFETDLPFLKVGEKIDFTLQAFPGEKFTGRIAFIDPIVDAQTRTAKVRVDVPNRSHLLKPEMYAIAEAEAMLGGGAGDEIVVPKSAVLWTGKRSVVYVKMPDASSPTFMLREIELGASLGDAYVVLDGLREGEEIVTEGVYAIDASAQLSGKNSMMNDEQRMSLRSMTKVSFGVGGACGMCKQRIEETALSVDGVGQAEWDDQTHQLTVRFDEAKTSVRDISRALAAVGHDTDFDKADDAVYEALPGCCHYR